MHYPVNKYRCFFTHFQLCSFHVSLHSVLSLNVVLYTVVHVLWNVCCLMCVFDLTQWRIMSVPCHEGPPATRGHFCSEPAVAGGGRYYCTRVYFQVHEWMGSRTNWTQKNGYGSKHGVDLNHEQQIYHLLQMISWKSSGTNAKQTVIHECVHVQESRAGVFSCMWRIQRN